MLNFKDNLWMEERMAISNQLPRTIQIEKKDFTISIDKKHRGNQIALTE